MADGKLTMTGQSEAVKEAMKLEWKRQEEMTDAMGNTVKIKAPKKKLRCVCICCVVPLSNPCSLPV